MSWVDIGIIALVVLLGLLGVLKGFKKSILSLGAFIVSFILAFFLANVIAEALLGLEGVKGFVLGNGFGEDADFSLAKMIYGLMGKNTTVPSEFLLKNYTAPILEIIANSKVAIADPSQGYALYLAFIMFSAICGVGIFIVVRFLLVIVTVIIKSYIDKKKSPVSRLGGFFIGAIRGGLWAFAITLVFSCFGGMTFMPGMNYVEDEYEHKNAVFCQYFNIGAYYIRNKLFLPNADTYGRMVEMVFKKGAGEGGDPNKLTDEQAKLYVNISNLNYNGTPWTWNGDEHMCVFEGGSAEKYNAEDFADVGFDQVMKSIFDYNESAAALILTGTLTDGDITAYNDFAYINSNSIAKSLDALVPALRVYQSNYDYGKKLTDNSEISNWNVTLSANYNAIKDLIDNIALQYSYMPNLGEFPDIKALIPERVNAGPQGEPAPALEMSKQSVRPLETSLIRKAAII